MGKRGPKPLDVDTLAARLHPHLSSTDPEQHWFWTGRVQHTKGGLAGKKGRRFTRLRVTGGEYDRVDYVAHKPRALAQGVSLMGKTVTVHRALAYLHRGHEWPGLRPPNWEGFRLVRPCVARGPNGVACCNPWHAAMLYTPPPPTGPRLDEPTSDELVAELADLIADWCDRNAHANRAAFEALFVEPGDWSADELAQALQQLHLNQALSPRWRSELRLT